MKASDVMVANVITISPDASVPQVAELLLTNRISAVPVVDAKGAMVGIVSEGDLIRRADAGTGHSRSWWLRLVMGREALALEYIKEHSRKVADVMTRRVITATPDMSVGEVATLLERNAIKRVPIVQDGHIVGIVSRANLLQALASLNKQISIDKPRADAELRDEVMARLSSEPWARTALINVTVAGGTVDLWGVVDSAAEKKAIRVATEVTPGVHAINDNVIVRPVATGS
ncbi:MAG: CBS domain-containing protein [Proteobacteria bacterium]|nr:CBS domain-containing protein [Pseudomonadota bacterium]